MDETALQKVLMELVAYAKDDHKYIVTLGNELASLRDALDEMSGGKFKPIWDRHRGRMNAKTAVLEQEIDAQYDELIRKIMAL
jgi:hypothetical protein